jgi:hypothetical protein
MPGNVMMVLSLNPATLSRLAAALDCPFVVLFQEDSADEAGDSFFVGEDSDNIGSPRDLTIEALDGVVAVKLGAMLRREGHVGQDVLFGAVHQGI